MTKGFLAGATLRHGVEHGHFRKPKFAVSIDTSVQSHRFKRFLTRRRIACASLSVNLGMTWNSFFALAIGPDVSASHRRKVPAPMGEGFPPSHVSFAQRSPAGGLTVHGCSRKQTLHEVLV